jgi:hypothetical protein
MGDITSASAKLYITIPGILNAAQQIQGFATDDVFTADPVEIAQTQMGVDGHLSAGFIFSEKKTRIVLQADSGSHSIFVAWYNAMKTTKSTYYANATLTLPATGKIATYTKGYLVTSNLISDVKKILQPQTYNITWQDVSITYI